MTSIKIKDAQYEHADVDIIAEQQRHLNPQERAQLKHLLQKYMKLFSGKLGSYPHCKLHLYVLIHLAMRQKQLIVLTLPYKQPPMLHKLA
jgi:hypothetical protein